MEVCLFAPLLNTNASLLNASLPPSRLTSFWLDVTPPALGKLTEEHGVSAARDICVSALGWQPHYFDAMMERHREAVASGNISD